MGQIILPRGSGDVKLIKYASVLLEIIALAKKPSTEGHVTRVSPVDKVLFHNFWLTALLQDFFAI